MKLKLYSFSRYITLPVLLFLFSTTVHAQTYCTPVYSTGCTFGDDINNFSLTGVNSTSFNDVNTGCSTGSYDNRTAQTPVQMLQGGTYNGSINSNYSGNEHARMWIDFNDNGIFDASESLATVSNFGTTTATFTMTIPATAATGNHRMRVRIAWNATASTLDPCSSYGYGEVHDYTVTILSPCATPTGLSAGTITYNTANLSWGAVSGAMGYEYAVTTSATPPATGTSTSATSYNATNLNTGTAYYLHVRTQCSPTAFSTWASYPFTTVTCGAPTGLTSSNVTSNSAGFSWTAVSGAAGYEYAITTGTTPPAAGVATTATSYNAINLNDTSNYCLYVRTQCAPGAYSAWTNTCITTLSAPPCPKPDTVTVANITSSGADISWTSLTTAVDYEYEVSTNPLPPASGTSTTATSYNATGLLSATQYYVHVRASCGGGVFSAWKTEPFITPYPPCDPPVGNAINVTSAAADITWGTMPEAISYQVAVFSNPNPPSVAGITTTGTSFSAKGLVSGKLYYIHLRTICSFDTSSWATTSFYTEVPESITSVNGKKSMVTAYPNPVHDLLTIRLSDKAGKDATLIITDITGKLVERMEHLAGNKIELNMTGFTNGIYLLKYTDEDYTETMRITKQ